MHASVAHPEDGLAPRPDRQRRSAKKNGTSGVKAACPWLRLSLGCGAAVTVLAYIIERQDVPPEPAGVLAPPSPASAPPPPWTPVPRPLPIYGIDAPHLKALPFAFAARRDAAGAREDTLAFGAFDRQAEPHLRVILHRSPHPEPPEPSLFLDLARRASEAGLAVVRSTPAEGLATKFGVMEASETTLSESSESSERACLAFRFAHQDIGFRAAGWMCPPQGQAMDRQELACTLERLSLIEAGNDETLKLLFAHADRQRIDGCSPALSAAEPTTRTSGQVSRAHPPRSRAERAQAARAAQKGSATLPRGTARGAGSASPDSRG
jgi:hypothetical protein